MNFVTAPLIADLFLLAISAIGQKEVYDSTVGLGADSFSPIDIIAFFITLAYITISIAASGLIQYLAFRVLQWGDNVGRRLFFYLYAFLFGLGAVMGGDAVVLSSTAFLAYFTRISSNIIHPGAWIHTQFAIARISSAILVSSNPTNLILASAFNIKFIHYTANIIVPVVVTALMLLLFLLYVRFADPNLIPHSIKMQELTEEEKAEKPLNPNIPDARGADEGPERAIILSMKEILNPFLDKTAAAFGAVIVTATLVTILALNTQSTSQYPVYWVTLPAAFVMFCWDITFGWRHRHKTREIARKGRQEIERFQAERHLKVEQETRVARQATPEPEERHTRDFVLENDDDLILSSNRPSDDMDENEEIEEDNKERMAHEEPGMELWEMQTGEVAHREQLSREVALQVGRRKGREQTRRTIVHLKMDIYRWSRETFPTATAVLTYLPFSLVPFIFSMFVLVQALVTRRWVLVFAYG
jgi:Na+/H+ antiporter NhaD/arsenite permease-like protein